MNMTLNEYCNYVQDFKPDHNIIIMDIDFKIIYLSNQIFFNRYNAEIKIGADIFECLKHLPCFETKRHIYDQIIKTKKMFGYFIAQQINDVHNYVVDRIILSPINNKNGELLGIELEGEDMNGLPLVNIAVDEPMLQHTTQNVIELTQREREIIILKAMGKTNLEISNIFEKIYNKSCSANTIANIIRQQIYLKFQINNKIDLLQKAHELGLDKILPKSLLMNNQLIVFPTYNVS